MIGLCANIIQLFITFNATFFYLAFSILDICSSKQHKNFLIQSIFLFVTINFMIFSILMEGYNNINNQNDVGHCSSQTSTD